MDLNKVHLILYSALDLDTVFFFRETLLSSQFLDFKIYQILKNSIDSSAISRLLTIITID